MKHAENKALILEAAEIIFIERGYLKSEINQIARQAKVKYPMVLYFHRSKEDLYEAFFSKNVEMMTDAFLFPFHQDLPFLEKLRKGIEDHFDFIIANPKLPKFIFSEVLNSKEHKKRFLAILKPKALAVLEKLEASLKEEVEKGTIRYMDSHDIIFSVVSINVFSSLSATVMVSIMDMDEEQYEQFLQHRKEMNVELILNQLRK